MPLAYLTALALAFPAAAPPQRYDPAARPVPSSEAAPPAVDRQPAPPAHHPWLANDEEAAPTLLNESPHAARRSASTVEEADRVAAAPNVEREPSRGRAPT